MNLWVQLLLFFFLLIILDNFVVVFLEGFHLVVSAVMFAYAPWHFVCQTESCVPPPSTPPSLSSSLNNVRIVCSSLIFSKGFLFLICISVSLWLFIFGTHRKSSLELKSMRKFWLN